MIRPFLTIGKEEEEAVLRVIRSGNLSGYVASKEYALGEEVSSLKAEWRAFFGSEWVIPCNSATSGLLAACMAIEIGPGDEVIVPYFTMSATASAPAVLGANVILADIDEQFCLEPSEIGKLLTENTKAVIATNMFGHPAQLHKLRSICEGAGIYLIEDNAQAIMATEDGKYTGTIGDIGVFSLNVHKHIQTGEGGIIVTNDSHLCSALNDAINHGESRHSHRPGLNLRMTELTAAVARAQLKKLPDIVASRREISRSIIDVVQNSNAHKHDHAFTAPDRTGCEHSYYALPLLSEHENASFLASYLRDSSPIPISVHYDGNLLVKPFTNGWVTPERQLELAHSDSYKRIHDLLLIETCSWDIQPEHIEQLRKNL